MTPKQIETRKRLRDDFDFYCRTCVKIRTKDGTIAPLILNRVQKRFADRIIEQQESNGKVRFVVVKARQQGLSTVISAWQYWWLSQRKAQKGLVMAHVAIVIVPLPGVILILLPAVRAFGVYPPPTVPIKS